MTTEEQRKTTKRKLEDLIVDPDTQKPIEDSKKPIIELDSNKKYNCLKSIVEMYERIISCVISKPMVGQDTEMRDISAQGSSKPSHYQPTALDLLSNINVGNHITSIIFTLHNICRQSVRGVETNTMRKTRDTSFKISYRGGEYLVPTDNAQDEWIKITKANGLDYVDFDQEDKANWYGTMGPYLDMFSAYSQRTNELRLGHNNMSISKSNGIHKSFPVSKYGLSGAHHVLLEGTSFPPERRSSIVQSLGPMTAWLGMIRSEGIYRKKYASAVKRAMSHIPCIEEIKELTKTTKQASEISALTTLLAEILLVTTARQATRMFFPLTLFPYVWKIQTDKRKYCEFFSTTGAAEYEPLLANHLKENANKWSGHVGGHQIDILDCRGQSYGNAANMSGKYKGMQTLILEKNPLSVFVPCCDPTENQIYNQVKDSPAPDQFISAPSSVVPTAKRPSRSGSRPRSWRVTSFEDKQHTYPERSVKSVREPIDYFDDQFYEMVCTCTNLYYLRKTGSELKTTKSEIQKLFGIHILIGCIPFPRLPMYWRSGISLDKITSKMSRVRFLQLRNALHVVSTDTAPPQQATNPLWKVQPMITQVRNGCYKQERVPGYYSIDEQMIPFTGRCPLRQVVKNKPVGLKN
ncbi:unnamed protein product [Arctia plantaginis]|uniref:PiggyBac transposable element-derived protein domain-containing protein n=1 Tax=Arctia plantaginis TaxID=874455 RepID=A0A8S1ABE8_ARCPL|nr:unnamed protein product [Arctia plantaginis]